MDELKTPRINGSMLSSYKDKDVCLLGSAKNVDSNGTSFTLTTSDNVDVQVFMQEPLNEYVAGLTEVHGTVDHRNNIQCNNYITFPQDVSQAFDMDLYNSAVQILERVPQFYQQGLQKPS